MSSRPHRDGRVRARRACRNCNARRVKCNVTEALPCRNCVVGGVNCELIESRRGKYQRPNSKRNTSSAATQKSIKAFPPTLSTIERNERNDFYLYPRDEADNSPDDSLAFCLGILSSQQLVDDSNSLPYEPRRPTQPTIDPSLESPTTTEQHDPSPLVTVHDPVFLGESTSLGCVPNDDADSESSSSARRHPRLFHLVEPLLMRETGHGQRGPAESHRRSAGPQLQTGPAQQNEDGVEAIISAYFRWFHPGFPVISQPHFVARYRNRTLSPLLLQAVLFVGSIHCDEQELHAVGHTDRHSAKSTFYKASKDIYNADKESDPITVVQSLFLLSFWRGGPYEMKDTRHWLGSAITLAQSKALHRQSDGCSSCTSSLRRRIWWCLCIRERQCASALGLPIRINDDDCDVSVLSIPQDFADEMQPGPNILHILTMQSALFVEQMCHLSKILADIIRTIYTPNSNHGVSSSEVAVILQRMHQWQIQLPSLLQPALFHEETTFYPAMIQMSYNNLVILIHRPSFLATTRTGSDPETIAIIQAACRNARIYEDLIASDTAIHGQLHLITVLFNTLCIHTLISSRTSGIPKSLAEHRARLCLLGLKEMNKRWEMTEWVLELFLKYLDRSIARRIRPALGQDETRPSDTGRALDDDTTAANSLIALQQASTLNHISEQSQEVAGPSTAPKEIMDDIPMGLIQNEFIFGEGYEFPMETMDAELLSLSQSHTRVGDLDFNLNSI